MKACQECGSRDTFVQQSRQTRAGLKRRRVCKACGARWSTLEVLLADARHLKAAARKEALAARRGCAVPPGKEADWRLLKSKRYSNREAAAALGLRYFGD